MVYYTAMKSRGKKGTAFWDAEYRESGHFALSFTQSEDLEKATRWLIREYGGTYLNITSSVLDLGCGNGRNLLWLAQTFGVRGIGYDISAEAVKQARMQSEKNKLNLTYAVRSIAGTLSVPDGSQTLVLDLMTSHFLNADDRVQLINEIFRVLKPGGFLIYKTFLLDEDMHARRMLIEHPTHEENTYMHPRIGMPEHVSTEDEIIALYGTKFTIHKVYRSHRHKGKDAKRRSIMVYLQKPEF